MKVNACIYQGRGMHTLNANGKGFNCFLKGKWGSRLNLFSTIFSPHEMKLRGDFQGRHILSKLNGLNRSKLVFYGVSLLAMEVEFKDFSRDRLFWRFFGFSGLLTIVRIVWPDKRASKDQTAYFCYTKEL